MKILPPLIFLMFPMLSFAANELEANGRKFTVHLDEHIKPYMALRVLHTIIPEKSGKITEAERKLTESLGLKLEDEIELTSLLPEELFFSVDMERELIRLTFRKESIEISLYHRMRNLPWKKQYQITLIDYQIIRKAEPSY